MIDQRPYRAGSLLFAGACLFCAVSAFPQSTVDLVGRVRTDNGIVPSGLVTVHLETSEGMEVATQPTGAEGNFHFDSVRKIQYQLVVTADGFEPTQKDIDLSQRAGTVFVDIFLTVKTPSKRQPPVARTDDLAPKKARKHFKKGVEALQARNLREAQAQLEAAVQEYPCYAHAQSSLALVLTSQKELGPAEAALRKSIECDADFLDAYAQLAQLLNAEKRFADSQQILSEGIRRSPNAWQFHYHLAASLAEQGEYGKAEQEYLKTQSLNLSPPKDFHARFANLYLKWHAYDKAYAQMQQYLRADPNGPFAPRIQEIMQEMKSAGVLNSTASNQQPLQ